VFSVYSLKGRFQRFLRPLVDQLASAGVTANQVTIATCLFSIGLGVCLVCKIQNQRLLLLLPAFFLIRMALNAIDGMLARDFGQKSNLGAYLNELTDVASDAFLYLPFAYLPGFDPLWIGAVIVLAALSELAGVVAALTGASRRYDGPMGKSDRALAFGAAALWLGLGGEFAPWASWIFPKTLALLLLLTIVNRVRNGLAEIEPSRTQAGMGPKL
jgi:CDP-diacylglycerol--glycerol-3-phosphate 3-phosphatidyltransferase